MNLLADPILVLPVQTSIRFLVTAEDVIHSWAIPSWGVKLDAIPGRLNQIIISISKPGLYYGQCSEICGIGHGFMPITIEVVPYIYYVEWLLQTYLKINNYEINLPFFNDKILTHIYITYLMFAESETLLILLNSWFSGKNPIDLVSKNHESYDILEYLLPIIESDIRLFLLFKIKFSNKIYDHISIINQADQLLNVDKVYIKNLKTQWLNQAIHNFLNSNNNTTYYFKEQLLNTVLYNLLFYYKNK